MEINLTNDQLNAEKMIVEWYLNSDNQVFVLSGYAGTGKTFLLNRIITETLHLDPTKEVAIVTPTGKAASVLVKNGTPASTVHSLIYMKDEDDFDVDENGEIIENKQLKFIKRESIDEKIRLIVIDEASMVAQDVLRDILSFNVKCLFCGDDAQLPPVAGETNLLLDPDCRLTEIVRQAEDNPIIQVSKMAREGKFIPFGKYGDKVCVISKNSLSKAERKRLFLKADQIICGRNATRNKLNREIRSYLGYSEYDVLPKDGEKVICTLNDWEKTLDKDGKFYLVNGVIGTASNITEGMDMLAEMDFMADFADESIRVPFDTGIFTYDKYAHFYGDKAVKFVDGTVAHEGNFALLHKLKAVAEEQICRFEFAYAITCHKAQGSEFDFVIVFDESYVFGEDRNEWLYTAVTRAKQKLLIIR